MNFFAYSRPLISPSYFSSVALPGFLGFYPSVISLHVVHVHIINARFDLKTELLDLIVRFLENSFVWFVSTVGYPLLCAPAFVDQPIECPEHVNDST